MSKMDALRQMREARYEQMTSRAAKSAATRAVPPVAPRAAAAPAAAEVAPDPGAAPVEEALCGHRNMGGRTCTRESGHHAKSHRYS